MDGNVLSRVHGKIHDNHIAKIYQDGYNQAKRHHRQFIPKLTSLRFSKTGEDGRRTKE